MSGMMKIRPIPMSIPSPFGFTWNKKGGVHIVSWEDNVLRRVLATSIIEITTGKDISSRIKPLIQKLKTDFPGSASNRSIKGENIIVTIICK